MPESTAFSRRGHSGAAQSTTLASGIAAGATSMDLADASTWTAADDNGPFWITITDGTSEEQIEATTVSGNTISGMTRGRAGTSAVAWSAGATVKHTSSVRDFDEANQAVAKTLGLIAGNGSKFFRVNADATDIEVVDITETVQDIVGAMVAGNTETNITVIYDDSDGTLDFMASAASVFKGVRATRTTTQAVANSTQTAVQWNDENGIDSDTFHDNATNNTRLTAPTTGMYLITTRVTFESNATGYREVRIRKNGTTYVANQYGPGIAGVSTSVALTDIVSLAATDYVEVYAFQTSGGALNVLGDDNELITDIGTSMVAMTYLGA